MLEKYSFLFPTKHVERKSLAPGKLLQEVSKIAPVHKACLLFCIAVVLIWADSTPVGAKTAAALKPTPPAFRSAAPAQVEAAIPADTQDARDKRNEIIIEKNLFSHDRKKWVSEPKSGKQAADKLVKKEINDLILMGTVISGTTRYAVLRAKKDTAKTGFQPYMKGDYVQGYLVKEIKRKKVVLLDEAENREYTLYINYDKKKRVAQKTASKPKVAPKLQKKAPSVAKKRSRAARRTRRSQPKPPKMPAKAP